MRYTYSDIITQIETYTKSRHTISPYHDVSPRLHIPRHHSQHKNDLPRQIVKYPLADNQDRLRPCILPPGRPPTTKNLTLAVTR
jgi:hypothetical protein